jgi:hypothetical protein
MTQKTEGKNFLNINSYFMISTTDSELQTATVIIPQGNVTDCEIKQHI